MGTNMFNHYHLPVILVVILAIFVVPPTFAKDVGIDQDLSDMSLVKSSEGKAVVRFGSGPLEVTAVGDRLGRNKAEVKEIIPGRVVIEEFFTGKNGPNR